MCSTGAGWVDLKIDRKCVAGGSIATLHNYANVEYMVHQTAADVLEIYQSGKPFCDAMLAIDNRFRSFLLHVVAVTKSRIAGTIAKIEELSAADLLNCVPTRPGFNNP